MTSTEKFTTKQARWISPVFYGLVFYIFGASMMDSFVVYHIWKFVGEAEFVKMHMESGSRIVPFFVVPTLVMTVFLVLQFWHRPLVVSRRQVWIGLICTIIPWLSSAFIQIPMQAQLDNGRNEELLNMLIVTDWIRLIPTFILVAVVFSMVKKSIAA
jgi:hypothetical protein